MSINNVNFNGRVFLAGNMKEHAHKKEIQNIRKYSNDMQCDVVVLNRDHYSDGKGVYKTLLVKDCKYTGQNMLADKTFDYKYKENNNKPQFDYQV